MTGNDFIFKAQVRMRESLSTGAQQQSMLYPDHVRDSANELAEDTFALYRTASCDIVAGQTEYVIPMRPYRLMAVNVNDGFGNITPLDGVTSESIDEMIYNWRGQTMGGTYQGVPRLYAPDGLLTYKIFPVPNYSVQDGLLISGYYGVDKWWDMARDCPLPANYNEAVMAGTCWRRCEEMLGAEGAYAQLLPVYEKRYQDQKRRLYRKALGANAARRGGAIPSTGKRLGNFGSGGWGWWG